MCVDLTVVILTKNEEDKIRACMESFCGLAKRFVVVDSGSDDKTVEIAKALGADVYFHEWENYAAQLNWGLENTSITTEWTMRMDADETLTPELAAELREKLATLPQSITGVELNRRRYVMGKWIKHGGVYPEYILRIFRTGKAICEMTLMDEHMLLSEGEKVTFRHDFIDNNDKGWTWWTNKHNWYSDREVLDYYNKKKEAYSSAVKPRLFGTQAERKRWLKDFIYYKTPLMRRAHWYFIYRYFIRLGFLDGKEGLIIHFLQGYWYRFLVDAKIYEYEQKQKKEGLH